MKKPIVDQALRLYHSWLTTCPHETTKEELVNQANNFFPNLLSQYDSLGRSIVHIVASFGPEWALEHLISKKLLPDLENGWNPAHRAAYFGNILALRTLYQTNYHLFDLTDHNGHTPIDIIVSQSRHRSRITTYQKQQVIIAKTGGTLQTWGQNQNYTCGAESESARRFPEKVAINLTKEVKFASFSKYHGMCLTEGACVYSWGINQNGRLGYEGPTVQLKPKRIDFNCLQLAYVNSKFSVKHLSTADHHSIFIGNCGRVLGTGSNELNQLGLGQDVKIAKSPKMTAINKNLKGLAFKLGATGNLHTVLSTDESLYVAGRNVGQFGSEIESNYEFFTKVAAIDQVGRIQRLVSSTGAIALFANKGKSDEKMNGDIWLLENGETKKILKVKNLVEMSLVGGRTHRSADIEWRSVAPVLALLTLDKVLIWSPTWRLGKQIEFVDQPPNFAPLSSIALFENGEKLILAANDGQCYFGTKSKKKPQQWTKSELEHIERRAKEDPFSVGGYVKKKLVEDQNNYEKGFLPFDLERIPGGARCNKVYAEMNGRTFGLLTTMNQNIDIDDDIDALTKPEVVQGRNLAEDLLTLQKNGVGCDLWINNSFHVHKEVLRGSVDCEADSITLDNTFEELTQFVEKVYENVDPHDLQKDLDLVCIDGVVKCSKIVLMARSEYFSLMLGAQFAWSEKQESTVELDLFAAEVEAMVNFCQKGILPESIELISQLSIIADRFLMPSLGGLCQQELSRILVQERCPKAAVKAFPFSLTYNSSYLARKCVQIISDHLAVLLETGFLDLLDPADLEEMSTLYQARIDLEAIRMRPDLDEIEFTQELFDELALASTVVRKRNKSERQEKKSPPVEIVKTSDTVFDQPETASKKVTPRRPKKISLSEYEEQKKSPATPTRPNWSTSPTTPKSDRPVKSLNEIIEEESKFETPKAKKGWGPSKRRQARGQDIIRWEEEKTIELSKRSPSSPWGGARPVQRGSPSWPSPVQKQEEVKPKPKVQITPSAKTWSTPAPPSLTEIMQSEQKTAQKARQTKSLAVIEIEERAMDELKRYYQLQFPTDTITVARV